MFVVEILELTKTQPLSHYQLTHAYTINSYVIDVVLEKTLYYKYFIGFFIVTELFSALTNGGYFLLKNNM